MKKIYSRTNLFQFIQTSFKRNKSDSIYFDLENWDKIYVEVNIINRFIYVYMITNHITKAKNNISLLLWLNVNDINWINNFCNKIEVYLKSQWVSKKVILDKIFYCDYKFDEVSEIDFDNIKR